MDVSNPILSLTLVMTDEITISIIKKNVFLLSSLNKQCKMNRGSHSNKGLFKSIHFLNHVINVWWCNKLIIVQVKAHSQPGKMDGLRMM